ncbi:unnamed protein product [Symbiodinium microadriaticum]|nr:unnamed protein product [Symbiodinium microadriaticum]
MKGSRSGSLSFGGNSTVELPWDLPPPPQVPPSIEDVNDKDSGKAEKELTSARPFMQNGSSKADFGEVNMALEALPLNLPPPPQPPPPLWQAGKAAVDTCPCPCSGHSSSQCSRPFRPSGRNPWESPASLHEQDWEHKAREFFNPGIQAEKPEFDTAAMQKWGEGIEGLADLSPLSSHQNLNAVESQIFGEWQLQAREALINETLDDITFVQESYAAAERDLEWRKATTMSKRQQIETRQAELAVYQKRVQVQEKDVVADEELIRCREAQLDADAQHLRRCENALKAEAKRVKQRRDDLDSSEPMLQRKEEELVRMQEELSKLEKEVSEAEQEIQHRSADIASAEAQLRRRRAELSSRHAEVAGDRRVLNGREAELQHSHVSHPPVPDTVVAQVPQVPSLHPQVQSTPQAAVATAPCAPAFAQPFVPSPVPPTPVVAPPMLAPPTTPAPADPVQQNLALQLQQTQQMLQMQQMQQLQHFMKGGFGDDVKEKERENKLQVLEETVLERLEALERHEAALAAVMAAAAQAAKETQEATAAIVSQSTEAAKDTAAAIMAKSSEVVRSAVQDMTEALAVREREAQEALQAMTNRSAMFGVEASVKTVPVHQNVEPLPQPSVQTCTSEPVQQAAPAMPVSVACNTDRLDLPENVEEALSSRPEPHAQRDRDPESWTDGHASATSLRNVYEALQGQHQAPLALVRPIGARRAALREGSGIEEVQTLASTAAFLRGEQPQLGGVQDGGELWCGESDITSIAAHMDGQDAEPVRLTEESMLDEQIMNRSSILQRTEADEMSETNSASEPSPIQSKAPAVAWEISLSDWPRTTCQRPPGQSPAELGKKRMYKAQEAAKRQVEGPKPPGPTRSKATTTKTSRAEELSYRPKDASSIWRGSRSLATAQRANRKPAASTSQGQAGR